MSSTSTPQGQHRAAILSSKGSPLEVGHRTTPSPGPHEILIDVKAIALNPVDCYQRDLGFHIEHYPAVLGSDLTGTVVAVGSAVTSGLFKPGTRVAAFATAFYKQGNPDYGAFQERVIVSAANAVPLPKDISFNEGALLPMAVTTAWTGWYSIGLPRGVVHKPADKQGMLVWGGASSVGGGAIQSAKLLGYTVYTAASKKHHEYLKGLGASRTFDYNDENVVESIVKAAKDDGLTFDNCYLAVGSLKEPIEILQQLKKKETAMIASAPLVKDDAPKGEGVETVFVHPPNDEEEREKHQQFVWHEWLNEKLSSGEFVPSSQVELVEGGLESVNKALDQLKAGASGFKFVLEV
ncbi:hypothetical protein MBLNU459_g7583t1 [Dothideomycetes sp. NU459]